MLRLLLPIVRILHQHLWCFNQKQFIYDRLLKILVVFFIKTIDLLFSWCKSHRLSDSDWMVTFFTLIYLHLLTFPRSISFIHWSRNRVSSQNLFGNSANISISSLAISTFSIFVIVLRWLFNCSLISFLDQLVIFYFRLLKRVLVDGRVLFDLLSISIFELTMSKRTYNIDFALALAYRRRLVILFHCCFRMFLQEVFIFLKFIDGRVIQLHILLVIFSRLWTIDKQFASCRSVLFFFLLFEILTEGRFGGKCLIG